MPDPRAATLPYCRHLRSKKLFFLDAPPREEADILDGSGATWCARTMQAAGPDADVVDPAACRAGPDPRDCFAPLLPRTD